MKILIKEKEYELKYNLGGFFIYEKIKGSPFDSSDLLSLYILLHSMLIYCNPDIYTLEFKELVDVCSDDPRIFASFTKMLEEKAKRDAELLSENGSKKKAKR